MVYSKELERDLSTTAMAKTILRLKVFAFIPSQHMVGLIFLRPTDGLGLSYTCHVSELKLAKHLHTFCVLT